MQFVTPLNRKVNFTPMRSVLLLFLLFISFQAFGQKDYDKRLLAKYSEEQIKGLQTSNPEIIQFWTYFLDHGYIVDAVEYGKRIQLVDQIKIKNLEKFNPFSAGLSGPGEVRRYFSIADSDQILIVLSNDEFVQKFKASISSK